ncbi:methyltransferase, FxLD system [Streptomyces sp. NPDC097617]|uniref:methyltransferase, FxLD system n=1 Tax=Streptomyces sp. NPDC097617 TaxID=3366091 RepID=UPI00382D8427
MDTTDRIEALRNTLVDNIVRAQPTLPARVEKAMRTVRRDLHLPGASLEDAYAEKAVIIKENSDGGVLATSCASGPSIVAMMLAQLDVREGDRILEIGAGTGYNAALLDELTGPTGKVTTVDIDPDVALHARTALDRAGYPHVHVMERDGLLGAPENAPYDRIEATVGAWDVPDSWWQQLRDGGRLVMPLRWRGQTRAVALTRTGNTLTSSAMELCGFVPLVGQSGEHVLDLAGGSVRLHHDEDQNLSLSSLEHALAAAQPEQWSKTWVAGTESYDGVWLRATASDDRVCRIEVSKAALDTGLLRRPATPVRSPALVDGDSLAYLIHTRDNVHTDRPFRLGAAGYGPDGTALAHALITHIDAWGADRGAVPQLSIHPASESTSSLPAGHVITKHTNRLVLAY